MCGISAIVGGAHEPVRLCAMVDAQDHRGPDHSSVHFFGSRCGLGHNRLRIIDLSPAGDQPMFSADRSLALIFNGEIYNYKELRQELSDYPFRTQTDTEVILAAYQRWGIDCLDRLLGMFAFVLWNDVTGELIAARDRFGVKPIYWHRDPHGTVHLASEIKALFAAGVPREPNTAMWANYLRFGLKDHSTSTFWNGIWSLAPGHVMVVKRGTVTTHCWYDIADRVGTDYDARPETVVAEEYLALLEESVSLRFRADVPIGINLSGGLDSSLLLSLVRRLHREQSAVQAFTFVTGDERYDELPWVRQMLDSTGHPSVVCQLNAAEVPAAAAALQEAQDEPFGGIPTIAYAKVFERARALGTIVLLDGQGIDEQWAGYDYYGMPDTATLVQGGRDAAVRPACLEPEFASLAEPLSFREPFPDRLRNMQYRDMRFTKLPRALRFNDRISMKHSTELREPFLDHRLVELALRQPADRKIRGPEHKWMVRRLAAQLVPTGVNEAPKRPLQTPQREWLRGPLREWANELIESALEEAGGEWLRPQEVRATWRDYCAGRSDHSFYVWQWITLALMSNLHGHDAVSAPVNCRSAAAEGLRLS